MTTSATIQSVGSNTSTVFSLPSPSKTKKTRKDFSTPVKNAGTAAAADSSYEEFNKPSTSSPQPQSPSLPWLVEYWSSSFLRTPAMIMDQMFSCSSPSPDSFVHTGTGTTNMTAKTKSAFSSHNYNYNYDLPLDESHRINIGKNGSDTIYFDDTIATATPVKSPTSTASTYHRKSKSLSGRWGDLRSVVASHDDTNVYDYYEDVVLSASDDDRNSRYPTKKSNVRNYRQSSIVVDDDDDIVDDCDDDDDDDDDIRMAPPVSSSPTESEVSAFRNKNLTKRDSMCSINTSKYMNLHTCHSFDQYIDTTNYLCATSESEHLAATARTSSPSTTRQQHQGVGGTRTPPRYMLNRPTTTTTGPRTPPSARTTTPLSRTRTPPSPALSTGADTYTTISLSQSYASEFDEVDEPYDEQRVRERERDHTTSSPSSSATTATSSSTSSVLIEDDIKNGNLFLDRLAAEQLLSLPSTTHSHSSASTTPFTYSASTTDSTSTSTRNSSPFRRLRERATNVPIYEHEERKEEDINNNNRSMISDENIYPMKKKSLSTSNNSNNNNSKGDNSKSYKVEDEADLSSSAFRCLIRMRTQNYQQDQSMSSMGGGVRGGGVEESKEEHHDENDNNNDDDVFSTTSSSILLPLHPHQRIIAPLPHQDSAFENDDSGYTYFRESMQVRQRFTTTPTPATSTTDAPMFPELW